MHVGVPISNLHDTLSITLTTRVHFMTLSMSDNMPYRSLQSNLWLRTISFTLRMKLVTAAVENERLFVL